MDSKKLTRGGLVAALYVALTYGFQSLSYGPIQFRISEVLTLLAYVNPFYVLPVTLGTAIGNLGSPFGIIDVLVGTLSSFFALYSMSKIKNIYLASLMPAIFSIAIGLEILILSNEPINFFLVTGQIMLSQFLVVSVLGLIIFKILSKNNHLVDLIKNV